MEQNQKRKRGRGYGGIGWIINKRINNFKVTFIDNRISILRTNEYAIIGVYLTANENTSATKLIKENEFLQLSHIYNELKKQFKVLIIGDFNCDIIRNQAHDKIMTHWLKNNKLCCMDVKYKDKNSFTYTKNETSSWIDHIVSPIDTMFIKNILIDDSESNCGDHLALSCELETNRNVGDKETIICKKKENKIIWNEKTKKIYYEKLQDNLNGIITHFSEHVYKDQKLLQTSVENLIKNLNMALLKSAKEITRENLVKKYKMKFNGWWDMNIKELYDDYRLSKKNYKENRTTINQIRYKMAKKAFRKRQEENKQLLEIKQLTKMNKLYKTNKKGFYSKVKELIDEKDEITIDLDDAKIEIEKLFNHGEVINKEIEDKSEEKLDEFMEKNSTTKYDYKINSEELISIIKNLSSNKAAGYNKITNEMFKYGISEKLVDILKLVYESLINYNINLKEFNIGLVKLLVKDKSKDPSDINNLRPLTISDTITIIFEKVILSEIRNSYNSSKNQYGFRSKSSCGHAVFALKELILFNKRKKKKTYACAIDASKAFDKVNRINLWSKMIDKIKACILRALINYYKNSKIIIFVNGQFTNTIKITRGVKKGGPLSPLLFSIYIDELSEILDFDDAGI
ncbi:unnamed protein product [Brachionus calyciflorus]|uniref:Reverse transcriptase domain-containing protein n=1 Tax=Brachionus calyciflorus TaxID=104777 RepID=A0A813PAX3_9BILA|nr:unnamed protein product [Brachionus calyciflorus]